MAFIQWKIDYINCFGYKDDYSRRKCVLSSCVTQVYMNTLETMALTEKQQKNVHVCEKNNLVKIIVGVKRADKRRVDKMRVEVGVKESVKKELMGSVWAGRVEGMGDEKLAKSADPDAQTVEG